jgi:ADP-ribose pyrophosphatase YjhB (NUDIX family)
MSAMTDPPVPRWRPAPRIRPLAIGLARRGDRLLVMRVFDDSGALKGVRPPGGAIEFGETAAAALAREFREEFGCEIAIEGPPAVLENLYEHHGAPGHEIVFAFPIRVVDDALAMAERFLLGEGNGVIVDAEWFDLARIRSGEVALFPAGLAASLA